MPDLQTALKSALTPPAKAAKEMIAITKKDFQSDKGKPFSTGVVVTTFNYVRDHPGCTAKQTTTALIAKGHPETSVSSVVSKLINRGLINRDAEGRLNTTKLEYKFDRKPIKKKKTVKKVAPVYTKPSLLDTISIRDAKALYLELKKIFEA